MRVLHRGKLNAVIWFGWRRLAWGVHVFDGAFSSWKTIHLGPVSVVRRYDHA